MSLRHFAFTPANQPLQSLRSSDAPKLIIVEPIARVAADGVIEQAVREFRRERFLVQEYVDSFGESHSEQNREDRK